MNIFGPQVPRTGVLAQLDAMGGVEPTTMDRVKAFGANNSDKLMALGGLIGGMSHRPNQAVQRVGQLGVHQLSQKQQGNKTAQWLASKGHEDLARLVLEQPGMAKNVLQQVMQAESAESQRGADLEDWRKRFLFEKRYERENPDPVDGPKFGAAQDTYVDEAGNLFYGTTKRDGSFGAVLAPIGHENSQKGNLSPVNDLGLTAEQIAAFKGNNKRAEEDAKNATTISTEMFGRLPSIRTTIGKMSQVVDLVDQGVNTGTIMNMLPSFTGGAKKLDQLRNELGLEVLADGSFGPLSEGEMRFALDTALPTNMEGPGLRQWALDRQAAQQKLYDYLSDAAMFLAQPGNTVADLMKMQKDRSDAYGVDKSNVKNWDEL